MLFFFPFYKHPKFLAHILDDDEKGRKKKALAGIPDDYDGLAINTRVSGAHQR